MMPDLSSRTAARIRAAYESARAAGKDRLLVALDGRAAAGKSTLAAALSESLADIGLTVLHMDDFFLRPVQRTPERLATPGGNVDRERFYEEVLLPLAEGKPFSYRPYDCKTATLGAPVSVTPAPIVLVEGSYACHPALRDNYDLRLFLSVAPDEQLRRVRLRGGDAALAAFRDRWIPLEEAYIAACAVEEACEPLL